MPWNPVRLNDGHNMPSIAFGTWTMGNGKNAVQEVRQALGVGFTHIDTAQAYRNEAEAGRALRESGLKRSDVFITTKWSGSGGLDVRTSIRNSLKYLGVDYVDLYLIHSPRLAWPDIQTAWSQMEQVQETGLARSIGVSNFDAAQLESLLASAKVAPAVNQILFHPYCYDKQTPVIAAGRKAGVVTEAYSLLTPITHSRGGPLDEPLAQIAQRLNVTADQVLLAWAWAKGVVVVTTSRKESRLQGYLASTDLAITENDIAMIDAAGRFGNQRHMHS